MILRSNLLIFVLTLISLTCTNATKNDQKILVNQNVANKLFKGHDKILLLSCVRCGCFLDALENLYRKDSIFLKTIYLITDTNCTKFTFTLNHISQNQIDSISDDLYNVVLFKKTKSGYQVREIETKESPKILEISRDYFNDN